MVLKVGAAGPSVKCAGEVDAHHESYKYNRIPQLVFSVVGDAYDTQNESDKQSGLHIEELAENGVNHEPVVPNSPQEGKVHFTFRAFLMLLSRVGFRYERNSRDSNSAVTTVSDGGDEANQVRLGTSCSRVTRRRLAR